MNTRKTEPKKPARQRGTHPSNLTQPNRTARNKANRIRRASRKRNPQSDVVLDLPGGAIFTIHPRKVHRFIRRLNARLAPKQRTVWPLVVGRY